jgi:hypothetical protein
MMEYINLKAVPNTIIGLLSAYGKEPFYESYGFVKRPKNQLGFGMTIFVKR